MAGIREAENMTRNIFAALGVVAAGAAAGAQTPSPSQPSTATPKTDNITVSGCLKPWTGSGATTSAPSTPSASTPSTGAGSTAASYVLTNVERKDDRTTTTTTPGAGEAGSMTGTRTSNDDEQYLLQAESGSVNLAQHVNHQVEVTGRKASASMTPSPRTGTTGSATTGTGTTGTGTTGTGTTGTGTAGTGTTGTTSRPGMTGEDAHKSAPSTLTVSSIRMISATCK
jgi:hypothetical protein